MDWHKARGCVLDAHAHLEEPAETVFAEREKRGIYTWLCGMYPEECARIEILRREDPVFAGAVLPVYGLHPWYCDQYECSDMLVFLEQAAVIGEIGMDSLWCEVPLKRQEEIFTWQLAFAREAQKPVLLHTKDQERRIDALLENYDGSVCIHWYSGPMDVLKRWAARGYYFTIGPENPHAAVSEWIMENVPLSRLLVETDGRSAVAWARNRPVSEGELAGVLSESLSVIAGKWGISVENARTQIWENAERFLKNK